jgi:hypothetical protein
MKPRTRFLPMTETPVWQAWLAVALLCWLSVPCAAAGPPAAPTPAEHCHEMPSPGHDRPVVDTVCHHCLCAAPLPSASGTRAAIRNASTPSPSHIAVASMRISMLDAHCPMRVDKPRAPPVTPLQTALRHRVLLI